MTLRNVLISFLFIISLALSTWSILISNPTPRSPHAENITLPDAYMENIVTTVMNKQGTPSLKLSTPKMTHYAYNDATEIESPSVTVYRNSPNPWDISATHAKATQGIAEINFWENVTIHHLADKSNPATTMQTTALTVFPNTQIAQTDQPVVIKQPDTLIQATGMQANMNDGTVKLLSQAKGEYAPATS